MAEFYPRSKTLAALKREMRLHLQMDHGPSPLETHRFSIQWLCARLDEQDAEIARLKEAKVPAAYRVAEGKVPGG